ncbi:MAG TPA: relaxase/mobilization nuclease domain-containing protein [Puia sp.]|nr:relaxase/mobilization nuclease domain-containing protein [Puia sp.]
MRAHIRFNKRVYTTLYYHEEKQKLGVAECIAAGNFLKDLPDLAFRDKQYQLQRLASLNEAATNKVLHISLTFSPSEKISNQQMAGLAEEYLQRMKLAHQPYLVYRHYDTLHPHMHVVMPGVQKDATRLSLFWADYYESANIAREITLKHHLVPSPTAEEIRQRQGQAQKIKYGEMSLRPAIGYVLSKVLNQYKYPSLEGLNAHLRLYNLQIYRGREDSNMYLHRGLVFRVLDENGKPLLNIGQFKASSIDKKLTLDRLEQRMAEGLKEPARQQHRQRVATLLEWHITKKNMDLSGLEKALQREQISMAWMDDGRSKDQKLFVIDHASKMVFDGHELGNGYDATTLRQRLAPTPIQEQKQVQQHQQRHRLRYEL